MRGWRILIVLALAVCVGCSSDSGDSGQAGNVPPPPEVGQCRNTPDSNLGPKDWFDGSPVVDCSQPHTLQTLYIIDTDDEITSSLVAQLEDNCDNAKVADYVDSPGFGAYNLVWPIANGPTPEQVSAGQSWIRCDAGILAESHCCRPLAPVSTSLEGAMDEHLARYQQCLAEVPDLDRSQPLVSCEEPHRAEMPTVGVRLDASKYPSAAKLKKSGQSLCGELVADRDDADSLVLTPAWQPENEWQGGTLFAACWIHRKSGLLPAL